MKKGILCTALMLVLLLVCIVALPTEANAATEGFYTYYVYDGGAEIVDVNTSISGNVTVPSTLGGYPVTVIRDDAFYFCTSLTSVNIPDSVTSIGDYAFAGCTSLTSVNIPDSVTSIGDYAFARCTSLTSITIPDSVISIGKDAFNYCESLTSVNIPDSVTSIGVEAFSQCESLTSVTIGNGVTSIGDRAFYYCTSLTSVTIPDGVTSIGDRAFYYCTSLTSVTIPDGVTGIANGLFEYCYDLTGVTIPDSVTSIGSSAFFKCANLTDVAIPNGVISIGDLAFDSCDSLTSIIIPDSVTSIGYSAFAYCDGLVSVTIGNGVTSMDSFAFAYNKSLTSITIPDNVISIGSQAFYDCAKLTGIWVDPNNPSYCSDNYGVLFDKNKTALIQAHCALQGEYRIPNSVTSIGPYAFWKCSGLTSITISDSVTSIGQYAFYSCDNLTSITIPGSVTSIGTMAFYSCDNLTTVNYKGSQEDWNEITIYDYNEPLLNATIVYNYCQHNFTYGICTLCGAVADNIVAHGTCGDNLTWTLDDTGTLTISGTGAMTNYSYDSSSPTYSTHPWKNVASSIKQVAIADGVTSIGDYAFYWCGSLTRVTIGNNVTSIGDAAFECCGLTGVTIPDSVTSIGNSAFSLCTSLTSVTIPNSVTSISNYAFFQCISLTSVTIPNSVTSIGNGIFQLCTRLTSVTIPDSVTSIGAYAFRDCDSLISVTIPDSVTSIGGDAFSYCDNLTSVTIPNSVTSIGDWAFYNCESLKNVYYKGYCTEWPEIQINNGNAPLLNATITYAKHNAYAGSVTQEPTKTATGKMTYTCSYCGDTYTEVIPALFYGTNTDLGNTLNVNFYFYKGLVGTDGYVKIVRSFADGTTETTTKSLSEFGLNGDYYQITYPGLAAMEMNDEVSVTVYDKDGNQVSETKTDSICSYARRALDKITDSVSRRMYVDMLNYGAAAQQNFGYATANLANSILTESEKAEGTQSVAALTNSYTRENNNYYGTNFDLESEISLNLYVLASAIGENGYAEISYTNHRGEEITKTVTEYVANGNCYMFTPDFVVAADGRCLLTIQFYKADGTPVVKVTDSMESYVARAIETDSAKYSWMEYMMIYSDSAREYLNR